METTFHIPEILLSPLAHISIAVIVLSFIGLALLGYSADKKIKKVKQLYQKLVRIYLSDPDKYSPFGLNYYDEKTQREIEGGDFSLLKAFDHIFTSMYSREIALQETEKILKQIDDYVSEIESSDMLGFESQTKFLHDITPSFETVYEHIDHYSLVHKKLATDAHTVALADKIKELAHMFHRASVLCPKLCRKHQENMRKLDAKEANYYRIGLKWRILLVTLKNLNYRAANKRKADRKKNDGKEVS